MGLGALFGDAKAHQSPPLWQRDWLLHIVTSRRFYFILLNFHIHCRTSIYIIAW